MKNMAIILGGLLALTLVLTAAGAQELPPPGKDLAPAPEPKVEENKDAADEELYKVLEGLTPEELRDLIKKSAQLRLTAERRQVAAEIDASLVIKQDLKDAARKVLDDNPANTQKDNIDRISRTFCKIDERFDAAYKLYKEGKFAEAAEAFKKIASTKEVNYFGAAKSYLLGDSLVKAGLVNLDSADVTKSLAARKVVWEAIDNYIDMLDNMPDRVSFSASAAINLADACDRLGRGIYAMEWYTFCIKNFALTLDKEQVDAIADKVEKLTDIYRDPLLTVTRMMGDVSERLSKTDGSKATQDKQQEIVLLLEDLIKTTEEKQQKQQGQPSPSQGKKPGDEQGDDQKDGEGKGGEKPSKPSGTGQPTKGANISALPSGGGSRTPRVSEIRDSGEHSIWSDLPPREREKLQEASKKAMSERYRDINRDYFLRLAEEKGAVRP